MKAYEGVGLALFCNGIAAVGGRPTEDVTWPGMAVVCMPTSFQLRGSLCERHGMHGLWRQHRRLQSF